MDWAITKSSHVLYKACAAGYMRLGIFVHTEAAQPPILATTASETILVRRGL